MSTASLPSYAPNHPVELTAHSAGFWGYSWRFPLWAAAHREHSGGHAAHVRQNAALTSFAAWFGNALRAAEPGCFTCHGGHQAFGLPSPAQVSAALGSHEITEHDVDELQRQDVPYGNDWDSAEEVANWTDKADRVRPWRAQIRDHIASRVAMLPADARVLELGSGPGFLAHRVLQNCPNLERYALLDFSEPMLALARERLGMFPAASFVLASFKSEDWPRHVEGPFDCILSMQAVHELRHKRHALRLYEQAHSVLAVPGGIMICDHTPFDDSLRSTSLYMTEHEQQDTLAKAGFANIRIELRMDSLVLYAGDRAA